MMMDRGYTSHEHLAEVGLIQMNGRLYDPTLRSFLMPDNFIQQPENTQNYNRYAYVLNNPLMYTDPSGELFGIDDLAAAIIIGAVIAATTYTMTAALTDVPFTVGGLAKATFIGAASAAVTFGIGEAASSLFTNFFSKAAFQAAAHGTFQGTMTGIQGGNFWSGFAAGALSSIAASAWSGGTTETTGFSQENNWAYGAKTITHIGLGAGTGTAGMIAFGTVMGGAGAALTGGNFWQGAVTGLVVSGLNHGNEKGHQKRANERNKIRRETVKPSFAKIVEVEGNTLGVIELVRDSPVAKFVRNGAPKVGSVSTTLKVAGRTLGAIGIGFEAAEVYNGNMSYTEFGVDTGMALVGMTGWGAPIALVYFGGKAIYEYSSGNTLFTKPK